MVIARYFVLLVFFISPLAMASTCPQTLNVSLRPLAEPEPVSLCDHYAGKVLLVVNTASRCGFTPQYEGLEALYERYRDQGLVVLGFPSNDFAQEPGSEQDIRSFCELTYDVKFPMFEKIRVTGESAHPLYQTLADQSDGYPQWNFHKYLLDRQGQVVKSLPTHMRPQDPRLIEMIEQLL